MRRPFIGYTASPLRQGSIPMMPLATSPVGAGVGCSSPAVVTTFDSYIEQLIQLTPSP
jgi:hypothetical protein